MQNHPTDQADASTPTENGSNMNRTVAVRRKAAKRTNPFDLTAEELHEHLMSPSQAEDIQVAKKPRLEEPLPATADEALKKTASPDLSVGLPSATADSDDVNAAPVTDTEPNAGASRMTGHWTSEEGAKLTRAVANTPKTMQGKEYKTDWDAVTALVPGRTKTQCREKWYRILDASIVRATGRKGRWTADEDKKLKDAVPTHGDKDLGAIAALVPSRTKLQCRNRWHDALNPSIALEAGRAGKWAEDEDKKLKDAVQLHGGKDWAAIAALVPSRTKRQCHTRWYHVLDPNIGPTTARAGKWAEDEVAKLKDALLKHGDKKWKKIAALIPGRTNKQCCKKWGDMESNRSTVREKARGTLKKAPAALRPDPDSP
jgi:hypothetical protein